MPFVLLISLLLLSELSWSKSNQQKLESLKSLQRIAFGSFNNEKDNQPLWKDVMAQKPDLWIWGGDNVYADWGKSESVAKSYQRQNAHPDYALLKKNIPIIGTWDDHDYAWDNAGGDLSFKHISQQLHLDFMDVPQDSLRRKQEGIYASFNFGPAKKRIKIILLDNRYFKGLEADAPILGNKQWKWLIESSASFYRKWSICFFSHHLLY